jgi:hypothetical protein
MKCEFLDDADAEYRAGAGVMKYMEADKPANQVAITQPTSSLRSRRARDDAFKKPTNTQNQNVPLGTHILLI